MDWDPEADAEERKQTRRKWLWVGLVTLFVLGYLVKTVLWVDKKVKEARPDLHGPRY